MPVNHKILGTIVSSSPMTEVLKVLTTVLNESAYDRPYFLITAYSETFLEALVNKDFRNAVQKADLVVGDGVSVWAALDYLEHKNQSGVGIGVKILQGSYGDRPKGVDILRKYLKQTNKYRIFLFGGWGVAEKIAKLYGCGWSEESSDILNKINSYRPDILFVALGRFKQEVWIANNLEKIKAKVVIGVGSGFDEIAGEGLWKEPVPKWVEKSGLKWLWRGMHEAKHWPRIWGAVVVFPLRLWQQKHSSTV